MKYAGLKEGILFTLLIMSKKDIAKTIGFIMYFFGFIELFNSKMLIPALGIRIRMTVLPIIALGLSLLILKMLPYDKDVCPITI